MIKIQIKKEPKPKGLHCYAKIDTQKPAVKRVIGGVSSTFNRPSKNKWVWFHSWYSLHCKIQDSAKGYIYLLNKKS
jgi:hypothetical protein